MQEMFMRLCAVLCLVLQVSPAFSEPVAAPRPFSRALEATARGNWEEADLIAAKAGPEARAVIEWLRLRAGLGDAREVLEFAEARPGWPGLARMFARMEDRTEDLPDAQTLAFFGMYPPQTGDGVLAHAGALLRAGRRGEAEASLVLAWRSFDLTSAQHAAFLDPEPNPCPAVTQRTYAGAMTRRVSTLQSIPAGNTRRSSVSADCRHHTPSSTLKSSDE